jgi:hypothetical protein
MDRIKYIFITLFLLLTTYSYVDAETCDNNDIARLKEIAKNVTVDYKYDEDAEGYGTYGQYLVTINGLTSEIYGYVELEDEIKNYYYDSQNSGVVDDYMDSGTKKLKIYSETCDDIVLRTINIEMPLYNIYSGNDECEGISGDDLDVCSKFIDKEISYSVFKNAINNYKNKQDNSSIKKLSFFGKYKYPIIAIGVIFFVVIVFFVIKHRRDRNVLD